MVVNPSVTFISSEETFCNFTNEIVRAGQTYPIDIGLNRSVVIMFSFNRTDRVYNVRTLDKIEDYEPEDVTVSLSEYLAFAQEVGVVCAGFGVVFALAAVKVRGAT